MTKIHWSAVRVWALDGAREQEGKWHVAALDEYRNDGGMAGFVLADPSEAETPEEIEAMCSAGPSVDEIDWAGFDEAMPRRYQPQLCD